MSEEVNAKDWPERMTESIATWEAKQRPRIMRFSGGHPAYREHCERGLSQSGARLSET
jgi:hypothetical protein